jgi:formamidopyrimidine-DNA glycosylase
VRGCFRRGKFVLIDCGPFLAFHLARAGWVRWSDELRKPGKPSLKGPLAAQLFLRGGAGFSLTEQGTQKRLSLYLVRDPDDIAPIAKLGPDVLGEEFTLEVLTQALDTASPVKSALSDQRRISGIGNAYSDEILHAAKLSPFAKGNSLDSAQVTGLYAHIREVLGDAVARATQLDLTELKDDKRSHMRVHRRDGEACPVCGDTIRSVHYSARSFQYCPTCQTGGKVLADRRLSKLLR